MLRAAQGLKCDCCGVDPVVGVRFACSNVLNIDLCSACVTQTGQVRGMLRPLGNEWAGVRLYWRGGFGLFATA